MKTLCLSACVLHTALKLVIALPVSILFLLNTYSNKANAGVIIRAGSDNLTYTMIAIDGKIVKTGIVLTNKSQIEISAFAQGQYFVQLQNKQGEIQVLRFVKK